MATKQQKEELIEILKFTPIKVQMLIQGYGGESYAGRVERKIYEYFKERKLDIGEYASDWDNGMKVPDDMQPFPAGSAYECNGMFHASGPELSDLNTITITDDKGNTIWEHDLGWSSLEDSGVVVEQFSDVDFDDLEPGEVAFWGGSGEKGCFFDCEFTLTQPFDPKKLVIKFESCDGWHIVNFVEYDGEELDGSGGYSTTGKWAESKWILGGDEEVYEAEEFDADEDDNDESSADYECVQCDWKGSVDEVSYNDNDEMVCPECGEPLEAKDSGFDWSPGEELEKIWEDQKTNWFDKDVKPAYNGQYEVLVEGAVWPHSGPRMADWDGKNWKTGILTVKITQWRGLNFNPNEV